MTVYYNENNPYAAQYLRNLIDGGIIAPGYVDERSIEDVTADDLVGYTQHHFFAGIGIWSAALREVGYPDDYPIWTGSCPCQPFSTSGKGDGFADERHLWPSWYWLITQCQPSVVLGEQVASKRAEPWIDLVHADMEAMGYAFGCVPFPSASVGAPHIRDRAFWIAHAPGWMAYSYGARSKTWVSKERYGKERNARIINNGGNKQHWYQRSLDSNSPNPTNNFWRDADWLFCRDGFWRPVEPGASPLVNGTLSRVGRLRAYGNGINLAQTAEFIKAALIE